MFGMRAIPLFLFVLINNSYGIEVNLALVYQLLILSVLNVSLCLVVHYYQSCFVFYCISALLSYVTACC